MTKISNILLHYVARGGVASFAISALDIALWDIRAKEQQAPLWQVAGGCLIVAKHIVVALTLIFRCQNY